MSTGTERTPYDNRLQLVLATVHGVETTLGEELARDLPVKVSHRTRATTSPVRTVGRTGRIGMADGGSGTVGIAGPFVPSDADLAERLLLEFEQEYGLRVISEIIRRCRTDLRNTNPSETPESLDDLARKRLATL